MDPHRIGERRSLALHRVVAARCREQPQLLHRAVEVFERWAQAEHMSPKDIETWRALFALGHDAVLRAITADDPSGRELRGTSPFAVLLAPRERWKLWSDVLAGSAP